MADEPKTATWSAPLPLDLSTIEDLADGDPSVQADLIAMFLRHTIEAIGKLRAAIEGRRYAEAAAIAHSARGFSATVGMMTLVPTLRELEEAAKSPQPQKPTQDLSRLLAQWEREFEELRRTLTALLQNPAG
jgi:HPt (histidine-containing phosphotransfer) domain-containing protein